MNLELRCWADQLRRPPAQVVADAAFPLRTELARVSMHPRASFRYGRAMDWSFAVGLGLSLLIAGCDSPSRTVDANRGKPRDGAPVVRGAVPGPAVRGTSISVAASLEP